MKSKEQPNPAMASEAQCVTTNILTSHPIQVSLITNIGSHHSMSTKALIDPNISIDHNHFTHANNT